MKPALILIMGLSATGKTTLSRTLADALNLPVIDRDAIKVRIFDQVGWRDREWSKKVGRASYDILYDMSEQFSRQNAPFILEADFAPESATEKLRRFHDKGYGIIQIICTADDDTILERWKKRAAEDTTHPSNTEGDEGLREIEQSIAQGRGHRQPLDLPGEVIYVDTSEGAETSGLAALERLRQLLNK